MDDAQIVALRLMEGGYVKYAGTTDWYYAEMPGEAFDAVFRACGGTDLDW